MSKIILAIYIDKGRTRVSHGINADTLETVVLPPEPLENFNPTLDKTLNEFVILDDN